MTAPDLVFNEPVATGALRVELYGDTAGASRHLGTARAVLGALRAMYGVNERIAAGAPGGFYVRRVVLGDGTEIEAITNDGVDTLRVRTVAPAPAPAGAVAPPTVSTEPYLWIGVRQVAPHPNVHLHACVWEPPATAGAAMQILSNRNEFFPPADPDGPPDYPLGPWTQFTPAADLTGVAYTDQHLCMLLPRNGLPMTAPGTPPDALDPPDFEVVFISDPDNALGLTDGAGAPMAGTGLGNYFVKFMIYGLDCPSPDGSEFFRPAAVEVEVRLVTGRGPYRNDLARRVVLTDYTQFPSGVLPFGEFGEANPHATHWWQGMATAQLMPRQDRVPPDQAAPSSVAFSPDGQAALPPTGFVPGPWPDRCAPPPPLPPPLYGHFHAVGGACAYDLDFDVHQIDADLIYQRLTLLRNTSYTSLDYDTVRYWDPLRQDYLPAQVVPGSVRTTNDESGWVVIFNEDVTAGPPWHELDQMTEREHAALQGDVCPANGQHPFEQD